MTNQNKFIATTIIVCAFITWLLVQILSLRIEDNCWSHYTTEQQAIKNCENHNE